MLSQQKLQAENFIVYGNKHHFLTRKTGFRVISSFINLDFILQDQVFSHIQHVITDFQKISKS